MQVLAGIENCILLLVNQDILLSSSCTFDRAALARIGSLTSLQVHRCEVDLLDNGQIKATMDSLLTVFKKEGRNHLLIGGAFLEDQVTIMSLHALAEGFPVYLLQDLIVARNPNFSQVFDTRLVQAGVIPSTLVQLFYQWAAIEPEAEKRKVLQELSGYKGS